MPGNTHGVENDDKIVADCAARELAVSLSGAVQAAVDSDMSSHCAVATLLLDKDRQALPLPEGVICEIPKRGET